MWQGILGHDEVVEQFRQSLAHGRLASSYLFLGPNGVGKRAFALKLAQVLLCQTVDPAELNPCGTCEACLLAAADNHPDLDVVGLPQDKRSLPVELFIGDREHRNQEGLCHNISLKPMLGSRRVAIIDDADFLGIESANCLLKTLEEPPPGAVLILLASSRGRLLPTILSRTQLVRFAPLADDLLEQLLLEHQIAPDAEQARRLAAHSEGSLERARGLADPARWEFQGWLPPHLAASRWDSFRLAEKITEYVAQAGQPAESRRQRLRAVFQIATAHFRDMLHVACQEDLAKAATRTEAAQQAVALGPYAQQCAIMSLDRCLEAEAQLDRNANQATLLECWLDDLSLIVRPPARGVTARGTQTEVPE